MKVHLEATKTLLVGAFYRPPKSSTTSLLELSKSIAMVREKFPRAVLMLAGHFNLHGIVWTTLAHTPTTPDKQDCELLLSIAMEHNMEQLNLSPTRKKNILELVLTTLPWITRHVKRLIRQTQQAYNRAKKSAKDRDWAKFWRKRINCQKAQKEAHWNNLNQLLEEDNGKSLWRYLKGLRRDMCGVSTLAADGRTGTDPKDKAEMLNAQFSSVFTREDHFNLPTMTTTPHPKMTPIRVGSQGVLKLLQQLNTRKASGGDDTPSILLENCAAELCSMLTFIYPQTIEKKCVPRDWNQALGALIFKKGNRSCPANNRPVSLTLICCKICEHIIVYQNMRHLDAHSILVDQQHGFRCRKFMWMAAHDHDPWLGRNPEPEIRGRHRSTGLCEGFWQSA